jgi:SAM-dependent methyltransferase
MKNRSNAEHSEDQKELFDKKDPVGYFLSNWRNRQVSRLVKGRLIDIACGDNRLVKLHGWGKGVDINDFENVDVVVDDLSRLPVENGSFDTATIVASINYFHDPVSVLNEINRVLKTDGRLIVTMANDKVMKIWHKFRDPHAFKAGYPKKRIYLLCKQAGFEIIARKYFMLGVNCIYIAKKTRSYHD